MTALSITVAARPAPQGSKRCWCQGGKARLIEETGKHLKPWRRAVTLAARDQWPTSGPLEGPLTLLMVFSLERPGSTKFGAVPWGTPDLSKLVRATEDALTGIAFLDDAQIVGYARLAKVWAGTADVHALPHPGALIAVSPWGGLYSAAHGS